MVRLFCLFLISLFICLECTAQEYPLQHYGTKEGLPHITVYRIYQDRKGFLWFCTDFGLSKFDGKTFRNYSTKDGLSHNVIMSVSEDEYSNMYVSSYKQGVAILSDSGIRKLTVTSGEIPKNIAYTLPDKDKIWIVSFINGGRLYVVRQNKIKNIQANITNTGEVDFYKIYRSGRNILFATSDGIYKAINDTDVAPFLLKGEHIADIEQDNKGGFWVACKSRVLHISNGNIIEAFDLPKENEIGDILIDRNNNVWIAGSPSAIFVVKDGQLMNIREKMKIPKVFINNLCEDNEGNIWIATQGKGVYRLNSLEALNYTVEDSSINSYCTSISSLNSKELILASYGKLSVLDNDKLRVISSSLSSTEFVYFIKKIDSRLYIGTPSRLICKAPEPPYKETIINKKRFGAISFCTDSTGQIIVGTYDNLFRIHNNELVLFDSSGFFKGKRCNHILYNDGSLWILTEDGTIEYKNGHYSYVKVPRFDYPFISGNIVKDRCGRIWFATQHGLICKDKNKYRVYTTADGLTDNLCKFLYEDNNGNLWVSTANNNINVIDLTTFKIKEFVIDIDIPEILSFYRRNNTLYLGTIEGLSIVDISQAFNKEIVPRLYINSVKTRNAFYQSPEKLDLSYNDNKLTIEFTGINYRHPENVEYRYMIRNMDNVWHVTKNNSIELSSLPGGAYDFVLSSRLKNSKWSREIVLPINIAIPFWKTTWFILITILISLILVYFVIKKIILRSESKKNEKLLILNKISYLKQQALSALINPHFIFNCMNSIQHYMNKNDKDAANNYLSDFATLVRMTMEDAQEAFISLDEEIKRLELYLSLEQLRFSEKLQYKISIDEELDIHSIRIPNMILQPYIENAILHGILPKKSAGNIDIFFLKLTDSEMNIVIRDNGVGFTYDRKQNITSKHSPFGMKLTEERLKILSKFLRQRYEVSIREIVDDNQIVLGTVVELILPYYPNEKNILALESEMN